MHSNDNPLFGAVGGAPTPGMPLHGRDRNPVWSPDSEGPYSSAPQSAVGFRKFGTVEPGDDDGEADAMAISPYQQQREWSPGFSQEARQAPAAPSASPEIDEFALVLEETARGAVAPGEALLGYAEVCTGRASQLRALAASQAAWGSKRGALLAEADALQLEAATWRLFWHLHGVTDPDFPAGTGGGFVASASGAKTLAQSVADLLAVDLELNRAARTVAWLEALAGEHLDRDEGWAPAALFASGDGVWRETMRRLENARLGIAVGGDRGAF